MRLAKEAGIQILNRDWIDVEMSLKILEEDNGNGGKDIMAGIANMASSMNK